MSRHRNFAAPVCVIAGVLLILLGIWRNEVAVVLTKAVNICLECIGIG